MSAETITTPEITEPQASDETVAAVAVTKKRRVVNYLNNADLLKQVKLSKEQGRMTDELAKMLMLLCERYATKGSYAGYSYNDDMQSYALVSLCKTWATFNSDRGTNPFAYYTQCIKNCFNMYLGTEKKQRIVRDTILVANGMTPSHTYQIENGMTPDDDRQYQFEPISKADMYHGTNDE